MTARSWSAASGLEQHDPVHTRSVRTRSEASPQAAGYDETVDMRRNYALEPAEIDAGFHLIGLLGVLGDQLVQLADTGQPIRQSPRTQLCAGLVHYVHVMTILGPVVALPNNLFRARGHPAAT